MTSHLFGGVWCASSSTYALRRTAIDAGASDVVRNTIMRSFYVDDLLTSVSDKKKASEIINGTQDALKVGGFRLTKFVVNDPELLGQIAPEDRAAEVKEIAPKMLSKALGVQWDVTNDTFFYVSKPVEGQPPITRRSILSKVSTMYHPLGLISGCPSRSPDFSRGYKIETVVGWSGSQWHRTKEVGMAKFVEWSPQVDIW